MLNSRAAVSARSRASRKRSSSRPISAARVSARDFAAATCPAMRAKPSRRSAIARLTD